MNYDARQNCTPILHLLNKIAQHVLKFWIKTFQLSGRWIIWTQVLLWLSQWLTRFKFFFISQEVFINIIINENFQLWEAWKSTRACFDLVYCWWVNPTQLNEIIDTTVLSEQRCVIMLLVLFVKMFIGYIILVTKLKYQAWFYDFLIQKQKMIRTHKNIMCIKLYILISYITHEARLVRNIE